MGGTAAGAGNVISGNSNIGVYLDGSTATGNLVQGNLIGTNAAGSARLGNSIGVLITGANNTVGGTAANVISGNFSSGVYLDGSTATGNLVEGNLIGTNAGSARLANGIGVSITGSNNTVGGAGNTIAYNEVDGVRIQTGTGDAIETNAIYSNGSAAIVLLSGGNDNQPAPMLSGASSEAGTVSGDLSAAASTQYRLEFFLSPTAGQAQVYLGFLLVSTDDTGQAPFTATLTGLVAGQQVTATATDPSGNTSALSSAVSVS